MSDAIRVGVLGAQGKMGRSVCEAIEQTVGLELVAQLDEGDALTGLIDARVDTIVDFTNPHAVMANLEFAISHGINCVVGTSGFTSERLDLLREQLAGRPQVGVLIAPNFGIAAVLMMQFSAQAARFFDSIEIFELHHPNKIDAPSGTATRTAEMIAHARAQAGCDAMPDATSDEVPGARGANIDGVRVHAARIQGMIAHQEVVFGGPGEVLTIRHDSMNRESFMPGVVLGVRSIGSRPGLTVGLEHILDLT